MVATKEFTLFDLLSDREKETLRVLALGIPVEEVGKRLGIGKSEVYRRLKNIAYFLEYGGKTDLRKLALLAIKHGLVKPEEIEL